MFFSTFYHACDVADANYSMCIVRLGVLQYSDFFCGLLSFWVTLVAMAALEPKTVSLLHMIGAVLIAFGTELNKQALLVFLIPVATGVCVVALSWGMRCRMTRKLFPARAYLVVYLPIGLLFVAVGLICFAFLQTNANYHIVHSIWHMVIALSILSLLPNRAIFFPRS
jgi:transmembrane protein 8A/B